MAADWLGWDVLHTTFFYCGIGMDMGGGERRERLRLRIAIVVATTLVPFV